MLLAVSALQRLILLPSLGHEAVSDTVKSDVIQSVTVTTSTSACLPQQDGMNLRCR